MCDRNVTVMYTELGIIADYWSLIHEMVLCRQATGY